MINIQKLSKEYVKNQIVLSDITLEIKEGEIFGLLGPNGAGKSTLISILTTLIKPTQGSYSINGIEGEKEGLKVRQQLGVVTQALTIDSKLTVKENLYLSARYYHILPNEIFAKIDAVLKEFGLYEYKNRYVEELSGGIKRRIDIIAALLHEPKVIFLDEPTVGLDIQARKEIWRYINEIRARKKTTIFLTTHYIEEAEEVCDRVAIISRGKIVKCDSPINLKREIMGELIVIKPNKTINISKMNIEEEVRTLKSVDIQKDMLILSVGDSKIAIPDTLKLLEKYGISVRLLECKKPTLGDVFLKITGEEVA